MDQGSIGEYLTEEVLARPVRARCSRLLDRDQLPRRGDRPARRRGHRPRRTAARCWPIWPGPNSFVIPARPRADHVPLPPALPGGAAASGPPAAGAAASAPAYARPRLVPAAGRPGQRAALDASGPATAAATRALLVHGGLVEAFVRRHGPRGQQAARTRRRTGAGGRPPRADWLEYEVTQWAIVAVAADRDTARATLADLTPVGPRAGRGPAGGAASRRSLAQLMLAQKAGDQPARGPRPRSTCSSIPTWPGRSPPCRGSRASVLLVQAQVAVRRRAACRRATAAAARALAVGRAGRRARRPARGAVHARVRHARPAGRVRHADDRAPTTRARSPRRTRS